MNNEEHSHSFLTEEMRMDVLESEHLLQARLANTIAFAALHANPAADVDKGAQQTHSMYLKALNAMPYFVTSTAGQNTEDRIKSERDEAIQRWRRMDAARRGVPPA